MSKDDALLQGDFEVFPKDKVLYHLEVTRTGITYYPKDVGRTKKSLKYIHFGDVVGCRCRKSVDQKHATKAYLTVFTYQLRKKFLSEKWVRFRNHITFAQNCANAFDGNRKITEKWRRVILHLCQQQPLNKKALHEGERRNDEALPVIDVEQCPVPPKMRLLVLVNPHSGPGKAMQIYQRQVAPMLDEADIHVNLVQTEYAGHAKELMKTVNRKDYYGVVIVSGDGLIYEVINGLMAREDWQDAMKMPIGCLPGGSGNALSCAINYSAGESIKDDHVLHATFLLIKHRVIPMDLVLVEQPGKRLFSFLMVSWGLLADIDLESEKYRAIGEARFTLQAVKRILSLRKYKGRLSFLPVSEYIPKSSNNNTTKALHIPQKSRRVTMDDLKNADHEDHKLHSKSVPSNLYHSKTGNDIENKDSGENGEQLTDIPDSFASGDCLNSKIQKSNKKSSNDSNVQPQFSLSNDESDEQAMRRPRTQLTLSNSDNSFQEVLKLSTADAGKMPSLLPSLDEPVPEDWVTLDEEFVTVCACYQTHIGSTSIMAPDSHFNDGIIHLTFIKSGIEKLELLDLMTRLEKGTHIDHPSPNIECVKCLAFRIQPDEPNLMMVDGEKVDSAPIQGQVLPGISRLMAIQ